MKLHLGTITRYFTVVQPLEDADAEVVAGAVSAWRHWLNRELPHALDWDESPTAPFDEAVIGEKCIGALCLLVSHVDDRASLPEDVSEDAPLQCETAGLFSQVAKTRLWLPGDHDFLFQARELDEQLTWVGSTEELLRDLEAMETHWKLELESRVALAEKFHEARTTLERLARRSIKFNLPLRLKT